MCITPCVLAFIALTINYVNSWDLAVTFGDQLELYGEGNKTIAEDVRFRELTALAYDAVHNMLLFVDKQNDNASIFSYHIATKKYTPLVRRGLNENIQGLAFDPVTSNLFWSDRNKKSIFYISLAKGSKNNAYGNLLVEMVDGLPQGIAVDSCRGYVYWTNTNPNNPSIERARFDGSERKTIVDKSKTSIFLPISIALDQQTSRLYWADDREGIFFSIDSSDLEGQDIRTEHRGTHHEPNSLTVSKDYLYWSERVYNTINRYPKKQNGSKDVEPEAIMTQLKMSPLGIAANYQIADQTYGTTECQKLSDMVKNKSVFHDTFTSISLNEGLFCLHGEVLKGESSCKCSLGYIGERCEKHVCQNYCLQGDCSVTKDGKPNCRCANGFTGSRCEVDPCHSYCLNNAACSLDPIDQAPQCRCQGDFVGVRCETRKPDLCHMFCLNNGSCSLDTVTHTPLCRCQIGFEGVRCEVNRTAIQNLSAKIQVKERTQETSESCNCTQSNTSKLVSSPSQTVSDDIVMDSCDSWDPIRDPIMIVLGILCGLLCVACAVLITRILQLKKRPRIRKRIIVNKNVTPLTARPDQCEITIENCCNMNVCETPCFEPRATIRPSLRDAKPGKEEKRNLIANMEQSDDLF